MNSECSLYFILFSCLGFHEVYLLQQFNCFILFMGWVYLNLISLFNVFGLIYFKPQMFPCFIWDFRSVTLKLCVPKNEVTQTKDTAPVVDRAFRAFRGSPLVTHRIYSIQVFGIVICEVLGMVFGLSAADKLSFVFQWFSPSCSLSTFSWRLLQLDVWIMVAKNSTKDELTLLNPGPFRRQLLLSSSATILMTLHILTFFHQKFLPLSLALPK